MKRICITELASQCTTREEELIARISSQSHGGLITVLRESVSEEPSGPFYSFLHPETDTVWQINIRTRSLRAWSLTLGRFAKQVVDAVPPLKICEAPVSEGDARCFRVMEVVDEHLIDRSQIFTRGVPPPVELRDDHQRILSVTRCRLAVELSLGTSSAHLYRSRMLSGTARLAGTFETFPISLIPVRRSVTLSAETHAMNKQKHGVALPVTLSLGEFELSLSELVALRQGTSLSIPSDVPFEGALLVGGERYANASINCVDGAFVVTVTEMLPGRSPQIESCRTTPETRWIPKEQSVGRRREEGNILLDRPID